MLATQWSLSLLVERWVVHPYPTLKGFALKVLVVG